MAYATMSIAGIDNDRSAKAWAVTETMLVNGLSLRKASASHEISVQSFLRAVAEDRLLSDQYERARSAVIDRMADEVMELADAPIDKLDNGATDTGLVRQRQLQVDTRKWFLSKLAPKVYGDRLDVSVTETRISISGALAAAEQRVALIHDVQDVQESINAPTMHERINAHNAHTNMQDAQITHDAHDNAHTIEREHVRDVHDVHNVHTTKAPAIDARAARLAKLQAKLESKN